MIIEVLFNIFFGAIEVLLNLLPDIDWDFSLTISDTFVNAIHTVGYILPMSYILPLLSVIVTILVFKIVVSIVKTIMDIIPFL